MRRDETYDLVHSHEALLPPMSGQTLRKITPLRSSTKYYCSTFGREDIRIPVLSGCLYYRQIVVVGTTVVLDLSTGHVRVQLDWHRTGRYHTGTVTVGLYQPVGDTVLVLLYRKSAAVVPTVLHGTGTGTVPVPVQMYRTGS